LSDSDWEFVCNVGCDFEVITVEISNRQRAAPAPVEKITAAVESVLADAGHAAAQVSVAVIDNRVMQQLNARHLNHDWPTDVLSFVLSEPNELLEGEILVNGELAAQQADRFRWTAADELLLYVVHGALHLVGYDDHSAEERRVMRAQERRVLARFGLQPHYEDDSTDAES